MMVKVQTKVTFQDFVDVQTRLVLLPCVEEEGLGAMVASHIPAEASELKDRERVTTTEDASESEEEGEQNGEKKGPGFAEIATDDETDIGSVTSIELDGAEEEKKSDEDETRRREKRRVGEEPVDIVGKILVGIDGRTCDGWMERDFTEILAAIRSAPAPIVLVFEEPEENDEEEGEGIVEETSDIDSLDQDHDDNFDDTNSNPTVDEVNETNVAATPTTSSTLSRWSSWGSKFAAEAAFSAKSYVSVVAADVKEKARAARAAEAKQVVEGCDSKGALFVQIPSGDFESIDSGKVTLTTISVLMYRQSAYEPCTPRGYRFAWYRSFIPSQESTSDSTSRSRTSSSDTSAVSVHEEELYWELLEGATYTAYQPNATDVGHRLRCVVTKEREQGENDEEDDGEGSISFETPFVATDASLFNCARQALLCGATYSNLEGVGNAEGRGFRVCIEIGASGRTMTSSTRIFQLSGSTAEPLHSDLMLGLNAFADPANPKVFSLILPSSLLGATTLLSALSTDGKFTLQAPNRLTRETLLLSLGIANFKGKPADLGVTTMLFPGSISFHHDDVDDSSYATSVKDVIPAVEFFTPSEAKSTSPIADDAYDRVALMEAELDRLRMKVAKKDKVVCDLQRQLARAEATSEKREKGLSASEHALRKSRQACKDLENSLRLGEKRARTMESTIEMMKKDHGQHREAYEDRISKQVEKIAALEKSVRSLHNEKAVLTAAVDARDSKLSRMEDLESKLQSLTERVAKNDSLRSQLGTMNNRYDEMSADLKRMATSEKECKDELEETKSRVESLCSKLGREEARKKQYQTEIRGLQKELQSIKTERNSFKQKFESLQKEISRMGKGKLTLVDIEKKLADNEARKTEVEVLKEQKRKALDEVDQYRIAYEQQLVAHLRAGVDGAALKALEQKAELERVLAELTEYVHAKEMQIETMKQVNATLAEELRALAKANMRNDEI